jgi:hypothetical protein
VPACTIRRQVCKTACRYGLAGMKSITALLVVLFCVLFSAVPTANALCHSVGWSGCADGGCYLHGGYCVNHGSPPKNDCECVPRDVVVKALADGSLRNASKCSNAT